MTRFNNNHLLLSLVLMMTCGLALVAGCANRVSEHAIEVTTQNFESLVLNSDKAVLVDFGATWCGPCQMLAPEIDKAAEKFQGRLVVGKVDVDDQEALANQFEISSIPAMLYFENGEVVRRETGFRNADQLEQEINEVLRQ